MISTKKDRSIAAFIQELNQHIRCQENQMCADMIDLKKARTRITELEEELKATREDYEEEIEVLVDKNADLKKKIRIFMGGPTPVEEDCRCQNRRISGRGSRTVRLGQMVTGDRGHFVLPRFGPSRWR